MLLVSIIMAASSCKKDDTYIEDGTNDDDETNDDENTENTSIYIDGRKEAVYCVVGDFPIEELPKIAEGSCLGLETILRVTWAADGGICEELAENTEVEVYQVEIIGANIVHCAE